MAATAIKPNGVALSVGPFHLRGYEAFSKTWSWSFLFQKEESFDVNTKMNFTPLDVEAFTAGKVLAALAETMKKEPVLLHLGAEAFMSVLRLARASTGKQKIIKFESYYHVCADTFLIKADGGAQEYFGLTPDFTVELVQGILMLQNVTQLLDSTGERWRKLLRLCLFILPVTKLLILQLSHLHVRKGTRVRHSLLPER
ncbi:hypothetical protein L6164_024901 [Bauhinia variegata]|uniref:Uncharacterized protein n=1 Tax=Bauhinia variegata TaxID=167791 RepID=A0ACB9M0K7_BAUVA|nr:hypothetical protein L6164_024901 [Bauhinia variegata]